MQELRQGPGSTGARYKNSAIDYMITKNKLLVALLLFNAQLITSLNFARLSEITKNLHSLLITIATLLAKQSFWLKSLILFIALFVAIL
jgi:hypothetical protein